MIEPLDSCSEISDAQARYEADVRLGRSRNLTSLSLNQTSELSGAPLRFLLFLFFFFFFFFFFVFIFFLFSFRRGSDLEGDLAPPSTFTASSAKQLDDHTAIIQASQGAPDAPFATRAGTVLDVLFKASNR